MQHRAAHHSFMPFGNVERLIDRYPHLTLFLSGFVGAILLLFFLWLTLFFGLPPARAQEGIDDVCPNLENHIKRTSENC